MHFIPLDFFPVRTQALRSALTGLRDNTAIADLRLLERWELDPQPGIAAALRVRQIQRANPTLVAKIRREIAAQKKHS
jgi:hypothetical protein